MTGKSRGSYSATYAWGQGDKLTGVTSSFPGEGSVTYAYGGDGKRRTRNDGTVTKYRWDSGWNVVEEEDGSGTLTSTLVGKLADIAGASPSTGAIRYHLRDHLGSLRALYDPSKTLLGANEYTPYGEDYLQSGATATRKFTGHDWDSDAGLYYAPYRYYSGSSSRWINRDPIGVEDGLNLYQYAMSTPVLLSDSLGLTGDIPGYDDHERMCDQREAQCQDAYIEIGTPPAVAAIGCATCAKECRKRGGLWPKTFKCNPKGPQSPTYFAKKQHRYGVVDTELGKSNRVGVQQVRNIALGIAAGAALLALTITLAPLVLPVAGTLAASQVFGTVATVTAATIVVAGTISRQRMTRLERRYGI